MSLLARGEPRDAQLVARYDLRNTGATPLAARLVLAARPWQVNGPKQFLNIAGGVSPIRELAWRDGQLWVNGAPALAPLVPPATVQLAPLHGAAPAIDPVTRSVGPGVGVAGPRAGGRPRRRRHRRLRRPARRPAARAAARPRRRAARRARPLAREARSRDPARPRGRPRRRRHAAHLARAHADVARRARACGPARARTRARGSATAR